MTGDAADNIKGAKKIGPKTAAALLQQFGSLEQILACSDQVSKPSIRASLQQSGERLWLNYRLICLTGDQPLPFTLEEMAYRYTGETSTQVLTAIGINR